MFWDFINSHGYPFQLLGEPFYDNFLGGARVVVGSGSGKHFCGGGVEAAQQLWKGGGGSRETFRGLPPVFDIHRPTLINTLINFY